MSEGQLLHQCKVTVYLLWDCKLPIDFSILAVFHLFRIRAFVHFTDWVDHKWPLGVIYHF